MSTLGTPYEIGTACCRGDFCNACPDLDVLDTTEAQLKALDSIPACVYNTTTDGNAVGCIGVNGQGLYRG